MLVLSPVLVVAVAVEQHSDSSVQYKSDNHRSPDVFLGTCKPLLPAIGDDPAAFLEADIPEGAGKLHDAEVKCW